MGLFRFLVWVSYLLLGSCEILDASFSRVQGVYGKFRNLSRGRITLWWLGVDGEDVFFGDLKPKGEVSFQTYASHQFYWRPEDLGSILKDGARSNPRYRFAIEPQKYLYAFTDDDTTVYNTAQLRDEIRFMNEYYRDTGKHWLAYYPRKQPRWMFLNTESKVKKSRRIKSIEPLWNCYDPNASLNVACRERRLKLELVTEIISPRVFRIANCMSPFEVSHLMELSKKAQLSEATVGNDASMSLANSRVNLNVWLSPSNDAVLQSVYFRLGDLVGIPRGSMRSNFSVEDMELNYAIVGSHHDPHLEAGSMGVPEMRFMTIYLMLEASDDLQGGELSFGKTGWEYDHVEGECLILYNQLEDGNLDEEATHEQKVVTMGHKYYGKIQIWDPRLPDGYDVKTGIMKDELR